MNVSHEGVGPNHNGLCAIMATASMCSHDAKSSTSNTITPRGHIVSLQTSQLPPKTLPHLHFISLFLTSQIRFTFSTFILSFYTSTFMCQACWAVIAGPACLFYFYLFILIINVEWLSHTTLSGFLALYRTFGSSPLNIFSPPLVKHFAQIVCPLHFRR